MPWVFGAFIMRSFRVAVVWAAPIIFVSAPPARAQFEPLAFAMCKKITADTARLKCFDEIGSSRTSEADKNDPALKAEWRYVVDKSPLDDSPQVMATLKSKEGAVLVLRCKEKYTEAVFIPEGFFIGGTGNTIPVIVRIDETPPTTVQWSKSTNDRAAFAPNAIKFIRLLPDNGKLFLRATGFQGRQADGSFDLRDVSVARSKIEDACHWPTPKSDKLPSPSHPSPK